MPTDLVALQLILSGILLGGIYATLSFGLALVLGVSRILNLAHGEFLVLGALTSYWIYSTSSLNPFIIPIIIAPFFFVFGLCFERVIIRRVHSSSLHQTVIASILVTLGASLMMRDTAFFVLSREFGVSYYLEPVRLGEITISSIRLVSLLLVVVLTAFLQVFLKRTFFGCSMRAITQDREAASLVGIDVRKVSAITFGLGCVLAAIAGSLLILITNLTTGVGLPLTVKAVTIVILGGLGSVTGSLIGSMILGISESTVGYFGASWAPTVSTFMLLAILISRRRGLFGEKLEG